MFWFKKEAAGTELSGMADSVATEAEGLFRSGSMHCAEAVLVAIRRAFVPEATDDVARLASGFGGGSGAGCICGAIAGGTMALGLATRGDRKKAAGLTRELQHWFREEYGTTCCRQLTTAGKKGCPLITGRVAGKVAELLSRQKG